MNGWLAGRVERRCGPGVAQFEDHNRGYFGIWAERGAAAPPAVRTEIEPILDRYLAAAERVGRSAGRRVGLLTGLVVGLSMVVVAFVMWGSL